MKEALMMMITTALEDYDGYFSLAGPLASYPMTVFSFPSQSSGNLEAMSFEEDTETFRVQVAVFDDQSDGIRIIRQLSSIDEGIKALRTSPGVVRVKYAGGTGPSYLNTDKEWRCTSDFLITMAPVEDATS